MRPLHRASLRSGTDFPLVSRRSISFLLSLCAALPVQAQTAPAPFDATTSEEVVVLSPFEVSASAPNSYNTATTLAGNRLNTQLRDVGAAVQVVTTQFLR
ncbi:MAG TPA: hypothetical protein VNR00_05830, partial [Opitutus sp.]|nr:hypothetical protein [Opitutus sp.]